MAQYTKRADGRYSTKVRLPSGKNKYLYGKTVTELKQKVAKLQGEISTGTYADDKGYTLKEWAIKWVEVYKVHLGYSARQSIMVTINKHLKPIENIRLRDLKRTDVNMFCNLIADRPAMQEKAFQTLKEMLEVAVDDGLIYKNPCRGVKLPKKPKPKTRGLTEEERKIIPTLYLTLQEKAYVYISWYAGLRPEEIRGLTKKDIDLKNKIINVNKAVVYAEGSREKLKDTKTEAGNREVGILEPLYPVLRDYMSQAKEMYLFHFERRGEYLEFWKKIKNKLNAAMGGDSKHIVTNIHPYVFRHEYATILYYSGIDIKEAVRLMGHTDIKMILNVYAELDKGRSNSTEKLNQFLANY